MHLHTHRCVRLRHNFRKGAPPRKREVDRAHREYIPRFIYVNLYLYVILCVHIRNWIGRRHDLSTGGHSASVCLLARLAPPPRSVPCACVLVSPLYYEPSMQICIHNRRYIVIIRTSILIAVSDAAATFESAPLRKSGTFKAPTKNV